MSQEKQTNKTTVWNKCPTQGNATYVDTDEYSGRESWMLLIK